MKKGEIANLSENKIEAIKSLPTVGMMMAAFNVVYSLWYGFAWGVVGWILFSASILASIYILSKTLKITFILSNFQK